MVQTLFNILKTFIILYPKGFLMLLLSILIVILLYQYLTIAKKNRNKLKNSDNLYAFFNIFYLNNFLLTIALLLLYIFSLSSFLFYRLYNMISDKSLQAITFNLPIINIIILILIIILITLSKIISYKILYDDFFKIYLYILSFDFGAKILTNLWHRYMTSLNSSFLLKITLFLSDIDITNMLFQTKMEIFKDRYKNDNFLSLKFKIRDISTKYSFIKNIITLLYYIFSNIHLYGYLIKKYMIYVIIIIILCYDLKEGVLKYIYIALPIFMIIIFYRNVRTFVGEKDIHLLDLILVNYFYKSTAYQELIKNDNNIAKITAIWEALAISDNEKALKQYIQDGFRADYFKTSEKNEIPQQKESTIRNIFIISGLMITMWFLLFNTTLLNTIILTIPLAIIIATSGLLNTIVAKSEDKLLNIINRIMMVFSIMILGWVYITRTLFVYMRETIWNYCFTITQTFTVEEKLDFLKAYTNFVVNSCIYVSSDKRKALLTSLDFDYIKTLINNETTIQQLKDFAENLLIFSYRLEDNYNQMKIDILEAILFFKKEELPFPLDILSDLYHYLETHSYILFIFFLYYKVYQASRLEDLKAITYPDSSFVYVVKNLFKLVKEFFN